jgi:diaminopimelate epimerase
MPIQFEKYQGTGNDFIMIDNRQNLFNKSDLDRVRKLCDRKYGIGADGLILIEEHPELDFNMIYFNADGSQSFCGNGSRCAVVFAKSLGIIDKQAYFLSTDGEHEAWINEDGEVSLKMHDVGQLEKGEDFFYLNTGSPHYVVEVDNVEQVDVPKEGAAIRYNDRFKAEGTNVNFVKYLDDALEIRTYERGVEDETLSCGTGVTAAALCLAEKKGAVAGVVQIHSAGGQLKVAYKKNEDRYTDIWLIGPGKFVFKGEVD